MAVNVETANLTASTLLPLGTVFLLPGFIWHAVARKIVPGRDSDKGDRFFKTLIYSILCFVIWATVFPKSIPTAQFSELAEALNIAASAALFLVPISVLGGILTGIFEREDCFCKFLRLIKIQSSSTGLDPWSRAFMRKKGCMIRIRYADGEETYGMFNPKSVASDQNESREIYLEQLFCQNEDGDLEGAIGLQGCWISAADVKEIRFYDTKELNSDDARKRCSAKHSHSDTGDLNRLAQRNGRQGTLAVRASGGPSQSDSESDKSRQGIEVTTVLNGAEKQKTST